MILESSKSQKERYTQYYEILPDPYTYIEKYCKREDNPEGFEYVDLLSDLLFRLELEQAVKNT
jgi:hypothetical protein